MILLAYAILHAPQWQPVEITVYDARYHGRRTANGERYDHYRRWTAASTSRSGAPMGSVWDVRYKDRTAQVRVNDTGSHRPRGAGLWLDLSGRSFHGLTSGAKPARFIAVARRRK